MASLRYHSGRMVLLPRQEGWDVRLKTKQGVVELPLSAATLEAAVVEAEQLYADARAISNGRPTCQQCVHWDFVAGECGLEFPEGRRSGGKYARECAAFWLNLSC
jgi:hypothetical protein